MEWINSEFELPEPEDYYECYDGDGTFYLIKPEGYLPMLAMYLETDTECGWYTTYISQVIVPVKRWMKIED